ncbi:uncharacterized protein BX664DRAFT_337862 [Halteromyces radiatus]|uniref:uncharacterized protein n=1 Tax=Halteromyces radiatus TaxID=101107 RepID=UPI0022211BDB|nr:uncharacterized protein BX664DRAFT_337862 [Halteromyces radiatus]KAI8084816.1 hypothetical protein BX664DRAFT_337862 [Halteromyces radiatus]
MSSVPTLRKKNAVYQNNVNKRGHVKTSLKPTPTFKLPVSYTVLGILAFALLGGAILQIIDLLF